MTTPNDRRLIRRLHEELDEARQKLNQSELLQMKWLLQIGRLKQEVAALKRQADDAKGVRCPKCSEPMVSCSTLNERICQGCGTVWDWKLNEGQPPLLGNNRQGRRAAT